MRKLIPIAALATISLAVLTACESTGSNNATHGNPYYNGGAASSNTSPTRVSSAARQIQLGQDVYANHCARCHGDAAQGTHKAPALAGPGALPKYQSADSDRTGAFHSAMDIAVFATQNMPPKQSHRDNLKEKDYWAVLAFALSANGVNLTEPVGPNNAASIIVNP